MNEKPLIVGVPPTMSNMVDFKIFLASDISLRNTESRPNRNRGGNFSVYMVPHCSPRRMLRDITSSARVNKLSRYHSKTQNRRVKFSEEG
jgi:hypothetical protein